MFSFDIGKEEFNSNIDNPLNTPNIITSTVTMGVTVDYAEDPTYSHTLQTIVAETFTLNTTVAPEDGVDIARVIDTANSWEFNVNSVEETDELTTIYREKNFIVDANTT